MHLYKKFRIKNRKKLVSTIVDISIRESMRVRTLLFRSGLCWAVDSGGLR